MIVIPKDIQVLTNLNSYYLDIEKLVEHFNGELDSGCIHFKSGTSEAVIFFDDHIPMEGIYEGKNGRQLGKDAIGQIMDAVKSSNFTVAVYQIDPALIYYWANLAYANPIYSNLSTEFTDLKGLIMKMRSEKLTGYIDVDINGQSDGASVFFNLGKIIGTVYPWNHGELSQDKPDFEKLIQTTVASGGTFNVYEVPIQNGAAESVSEADSSASRSGNWRIHSDDSALRMAGDLLRICQHTIEASKSVNEQFDTLLKKTFIEKADTFDFLDPFAAEFEYSQGEIDYTGSAPSASVVKGVSESVRDLADKLGLLGRLLDDIDLWNDRHSDRQVTLDLG